MTNPTNNHQSLTLDRGLSVMEVLARSENSMSVSEIASTLGVHRQAVYRLLGTLEKRNFATSAGSGRWRLGFGALSLTGAFIPRLQSAVRPLLGNLAESAGATASFSMAEGDESVAVAVVEPRGTDFHLAFREGTRHSLNRGAAGIAILAAGQPIEGESDDVAVARRVGHAISYGQITPGALGVSCAVDAGVIGIRASIGLVTLGEGADIDRLVASLREAAPQVSAALGTVPRT